MKHSRSILALLGLVALLGGPVRAQDDIDPEDVDVLDAADIEAGIVEDIDAEAAVDELGDVAEIDTSEIAAELEAANVPITLETIEVPEARDQARRASQLLNDPISSRRASAARAIARNQDAISIPALFAALRDRSSAVRRAAATSLGTLGSFAALGALRQALQVERDTPTARAMDKAIGAIEQRVYAGPGGGEPISLVCHSCGRRFCLLRKTRAGYCPYDGVPWTLR